jgi:peptidoglycan/LPS O-acetylase OafA/YrhL
LLYGDIVVLAAISDAQKKSLVFSNRFLEWLGLRSYGIYLLHKPLQIAVPFLLARLINPHINIWVVVPVTTLVLVTVSELSYRFYEKPFMDMGHRLKYHDANPERELS